MTTETILACIGIALVIALIIALIGGAMDKNKMITVRKAFEASNYTDGEANLTVRTDHFAYQTERVIHHEKPDANQNGINQA